LQSGTNSIAIETADYNDAIGMILNLAKLKLDFNEHHREILIKETVDVSNEAKVFEVPQNL